LRNQIDLFKFKGQAMTYKVAFVHGVWRTVEADECIHDNDWIVFLRDGAPVLTAITRNTLFIEPLSDETLRQAARGGLFVHENRGRPKGADPQF
jgi:hypothetical protein